MALCVQPAAGKLPKLATLNDGAEEDVLAYIIFPQAAPDEVVFDDPDRTAERGNHVADTFINEASILCLVGAMPLEQTDERAVQRSRYMTLATLVPVCDGPIARLPAAQIG